jgi:hypothetical protein
MTINLSGQLPWPIPCGHDVWRREKGAVLAQFLKLMGGLMLALGAFTIAGILMGEGGSVFIELICVCFFGFGTLSIGAGAVVQRLEDMASHAKAQSEALSAQAGYLKYLVDAKQYELKQGS